MTEFEERMLSLLEKIAKNTEKIAEENGTIAGKLDEAIYDECLNLG